MFISDVSFYSTDGMNWLLLPKATKCGQFLSPLAINKFEGDPSIVTNVYDVNPPFPQNEDPKTYYNVIANSNFFQILFEKNRLNEIQEICCFVVQSSPKVWLEY